MRAMLDGVVMDAHEERLNKRQGGGTFLKRTLWLRQSGAGTSGPVDVMVWEPRDAAEDDLWPSVVAAMESRETVRLTVSVAVEEFRGKPQRNVSLLGIELVPATNGKKAAAPAAAG